MDKLLHISGSPHVHSDESVKKIMWSVVLSLVPAFLVSVYYFGLPVIVLTAVSIGCCVLFEYLIQRFMLHQKPSVNDGSAVVTGLLLAFNVPSNLPIWIMVIGALVAIGIAKMPFGGLGHNPFNPALVARVTLLIAFPVQMTSWPVPSPLWSLHFADAVTGPTTLGLIKEGGDLSQLPTYANMLLGQMGGSFGEVSAIALLIGAGFLLWKRIITWHIPVSFIATVFVYLFSNAFNNASVYDPYPRCLFHGHRHGDLPDLPVGHDRVRLRLRSAHHHHPPFRRVPRGCLLLHPADERRGAADQQRLQTETIRSITLKHYRYGKE